MDELAKIAQNPAVLEKHLSRAIDTLIDVVTTYGLKVIGAIIILIVGWTIAALAQKAIQRAGARSRRIDRTIFTFASSGAKYLLVIFTLIAVLGSFGVQTTSFVAVLGAAGLAIGLALQGTLSHVASGLLLVMFRPFRVGDYIEAGGVAGHVRAITLFVTEVDTADNVNIVVPNGLIWSGSMKNFNANATRRAELRFPLSYLDNLDKALKIVRALIEQDKRVEKQPPPAVGVQSFGDTGIVIAALVWVARDDFQDVQFDINKAVKDAFEREGMTMSFAQRRGQPLPPAQT